MKENFTKHKVRSKGPVFDYQDRFPLVMGALLMAGLCCYYASKVGLLVGMTTANFYVSYFVFLFFIGGALAYIRREVRILDRKWNWLGGWFNRLVFQAAYCWAAPSLALFLVYLAAHKLLSTEVLTSGLFEVDLPWIVVLLLLVNLCYTLAFFVQLHNRAGLKRRGLLRRYRYAIQSGNIMLRDKARLEKENEAFQHEISTLKTQITELERGVSLLQTEENFEVNGKSLASIYEVHTQKLISLHPYEDIACFLYEEPYVYLQTKTDGQKIPANESSLVKVESETEGFFRKVNRNMALPQHMLLACKRIKDGKLELQVKEPLNCTIEISKELAARLRSWILEAVGKIEKEDGG